MDKVVDLVRKNWSTMELERVSRKCLSGFDEGCENDKLILGSYRLNVGGGECCRQG